MSGKIHNYEAWEERKISKVSVEYYLRSLSGNALLAIVGKKDGKGPMKYRVANDFLEAFGSNSTINASTKWTKRSEVRKWISSFVRGDDLPLTNLDHQGDGSRNDEEKKVVRYAPVDLKSLNYAATWSVVLALPATSLYESGRGRKRKYRDLVPKHRGDGSSLDEEEKLTQVDPMKRCSKKLRSGLVHRTQDSVRLDATNLVPPKEAAASGLRTVKFNTDLSSIEPIGIKVPEPKPHQPASFQVGEKIEVLCQDSGMRGCWFTCKIVKVSDNRFKVQYNDAHNVEASGKLEEWVPASRLADPDKRSLRHSGRLTVRPCPPREPFSNFFEVGASVESWWNNGWWESFVVTCVSLSNNDSYHVFLPGERRFLTLHRKDIRVAKDWINNTWVAVKPNPDILSDICLSL